MLVYFVANNLPSGVGSEKAISSLVRWLPYMKVLLKKKCIVNGKHFIGAESTRF